jgi:Na+-translocating ferredoxin:NAD+ oxidoreductase RnfG subunit
MDIQAVTSNKIGQVQQDVAVSLLKKILDNQQENSSQLRQTLPQVKDPALGKNIDKFA